MELNKEIIELIRNRVSCGTTVDDFTFLINYVIKFQNELFGKSNQFYDSKQISLIIATRDELYQHYLIPKKNGGKRLLDAPTLTLKYFSKEIIFYFKYFI